MNSVEIGSLIIIGLSVVLILWGQFSDDQRIYSGYGNSTVSTMDTINGLAVGFCIYSIEYSDNYS